MFVCEWGGKKIQCQHPCYALSEKSILQRKKQANMMAISETEPARLLIKDCIFFFFFLFKKREKEGERDGERVCSSDSWLSGFVTRRLPQLRNSTAVARVSAARTRCRLQLKASSAKSEEAREKDRKKGGGGKVPLRTRKSE